MVSYCSTGKQLKKILSKALLPFDWHMLPQFLFAVQERMEAVFSGWNFS
jgi:hypothetical protein